MAKPGSIRAGRAHVELYADSSALVRELHVAGDKVKRFGESVRGVGVGMAAAGAAAAAPLIASVRHFMTAGDALQEMSVRTGMAVESLSKLQYAAGLSGLSVEQMEVGFRQMQRTISDAAAGMGAASADLERLGVTAKELQGLTPEQQFMRMADALAAVSDPTERAAMAMNVFGRSGTAMLPMLAGGSAGLREMMEQAQAAGAVMSTDAAESAAKLADSMDAMRAAVSQSARVIGEVLAPSIIAAVQWFTEAVKRMTVFIQENKVLVVAVAGAAAVMVTLGTSLIIVGQVAIGAGAAMKAMAAVMAFSKAKALILSGAVGKLAVGVKSLTAAVVALKAATAGGIIAKAIAAIGAAVFSVKAAPIIAIVAAIGGLAYLVSRIVGGGDDVAAAAVESKEQYAAGVAKVEDDFARRMAQIEAEAAKEKESMLRDQQATYEKIEAERQRQSQQIDADIAAARKRADEAIAKAQREAAAVAAPDVGGGVAAAAVRAVRAIGTFNAAAMLGLQAADGIEERIAAATLRTANGVDKLRDDVRRNQARFT